MDRKKVCGLIFFSAPVFAQDSTNLGYPLPNTGISGVYEAMIATNNPAHHLKYFAEFGFSLIDSGTLTKDQALKLYKVPSAVKSYRLQNGDIDSHGLIRLLMWNKPLVNGVGMWGTGNNRQPHVCNENKRHYENNRHL